MDKTFMSFDEYKVFMYNNDDYITDNVDMEDWVEGLLKISLYFLKEYTMIKEVLDKHLLYVPNPLLKIILDYTVIKADPQKILETEVEGYGLVLSIIGLNNLHQFIDEGWDINALGIYSNAFNYGYKYAKSTPLIFACMGSPCQWSYVYNKIKFYLDNGADINIKNENGLDVVFIIKRRHSGQFWADKDILKCINLLLHYPDIEECPIHPTLSSDCIR